MLLPIIAVLAVACSRAPVADAPIADARLQALRFRSNQDEVKWALAVKEHGQMIDALAAHDGALLRNLLQQHLNHKRDVVLAQLYTAQVDLKKAAE